MSKIGALKTLFSKPFTVIKDGIVAQHEEKHRLAILKDYGIDQLPTVDLLDLLNDFDENLSIYSYLDSTSQVTDIMLLKKLARLFENCQYLEIGSWRGESIANVSEVAQKCVSISLSKDEMESLGNTGVYVDVHGMFSNNLKNLEVHHANSLKFDYDQLGQKFDLIFVDGDHTYEAVKVDSKNVYEQRKSERSIIVWHDYGYRFERTRHSVMHGILDGIPKEKHKYLYHVSNTLCAIYIEKVLPTYKTVFPTYPNKKFSIEVKTKKLSKHSEQSKSK